MLNFRLVRDSAGSPSGGWLSSAYTEGQLLAVAGRNVGVGELVFLDQDFQVAGDADAAHGDAPVCAFLDSRVDPALR